MQEKKIKRSKIQESCMIIFSHPSPGGVGLKRENRNYCFTSDGLHRVLHLTHRKYKLSVRTQMTGLEKIRTKRAIFLYRWICFRVEDKPHILSWKHIPPNLIVNYDRISLLCWELRYSSHPPHGINCRYFYSREIHTFTHILFDWSSHFTKRMRLVDILEATDIYRKL